MADKSQSTSSFCDWCLNWKHHIIVAIERPGYKEPKASDRGLRSHEKRDPLLEGAQQRAPGKTEGRDEAVNADQGSAVNDRVDVGHDNECRYSDGKDVAALSDVNGAPAQDSDSFSLREYLEERVLLPSPGPSFFRSLSDVREAASTCFLCRKIWSSFHSWASNTYGDAEKVDLSTAQAAVENRWPKRMPEEGEGWDDYSGHLDDGTHGRLCLVQVNIKFQDPTHQGSSRRVNLSLTLQKSRERAPSVADVFTSNDGIYHDVNSRSETWPKTEPYEARMRPLVADLRLLSKWNSLCRETHGAACQQTYAAWTSGPYGITLRLIDVRRHCIVEADSKVEAPETTQWAALSYVWGKLPFQTLTKANVKELRLEGALSPSNAPSLPATIADAMVVTAALGLRYLWTDSLCILQDSDEDKAYFIPRMNQIYGQAVIVIINAAGTHADSGLPGVRYGSRSQVEEPFFIPDISAMSESNLRGGSTSDVRTGHRTSSVAGTWFTQSLTPLRSMPTILCDSLWYKRGWTFQEAVLSQRWLVFTPELILWECRQATWREDACWELPFHKELRQTIIYESTFYDRTFREMWSLKTNREFDELYWGLVKSYTKRELTYEGDALAAFTGILTNLRIATGFKFVWGLPEAFLGMGPDLAGNSRPFAET